MRKWAYDLNSPSRHGNRLPRWAAGTADPGEGLAEAEARASDCESGRKRVGGEGSCGGIRGRAAVGSEVARSIERGPDSARAYGAGSDAGGDGVGGLTG